MRHDGLSDEMLERFQCPVCGTSLQRGTSELHCTNEMTPHSFPVVDYVPILINEARSLSSIDSFVSRSTSAARSRSPLWQVGQFLTPKISSNLSAARNYDELRKLVKERTRTPIVLTVGGGIVGQGMEKLLADSSINFVETDVTLGPRTSIICDAHDLPFHDGTFDAVIAQAVLEHVVDPYRCVDEIHRVLKADGIVYAEIPFVQQVHEGRFDFTRFTHLGNRRLFRHFEEIRSGSVAGPGTVLAWSYQFFLLSFVSTPLARGLVKLFAGFTAFWLKYLDRLVVNKPGGDDAASAYYFLGRKSELTLSDRKLIMLYQGAQG